MKLPYLTIVIYLAMFPLSGLWANQSPDTELIESDHQAPDSEALLQRIWKSSAINNKEEVIALVKEMIDVYGADAQVLAASLSNFPTAENRDDYKIMNHVGTALFVEAEFLMRQGDTEKSIQAFERLAQEFPFAQAWDPSRGSFWSIKEKSLASVCIMQGHDNCNNHDSVKKEAPVTKPVLNTPGTDKIIDYRKYGNFLNVDTSKFHYQITDLEGLKKAAGEGIYPNLTDVYKNPGYKKALKEGRLEGSHWDFVNTTDLEAAFYKWVTAPESWGVRLFYLGNIFEKAKMYHEAIKAYHAIVVHFPNTIAWTYWQTPWYPGQAAISKIKHIARMHPELKLEYKWAKISIQNSFDNDHKNDIVTTKPGIVRELNAMDQARESLHLEQAKMPLGKEMVTLGKGKVRFVKYDSGHWQLLVNDQPYIIRGITYAPTKVGQSPDQNTLGNWTTEDLNNNGLVDGPYEAFIDKNLNNQQDEDEPTIGDFQIMKDMGVNTMRIYHHPKQVDKQLLRDMFNNYGIRVIMGDYLGKYAIGSGASWMDGTDYENPEHQAKMMESVRQMVMEHKDEPYMLMWLIGNENNYGVASNADKKPEAFFKFANDVAKMIKSIDSNYPVGLCNGDTLFLDIFGKYAPDVDAYGANVYRGDYGFGSFWQQVAEASDRPAFITEYGAPAWGLHFSYQEAQEAQAAYHRGNWLDILYNSAGYEEGIGNSVGGIVFEWVDEWWKNYEPARHDTKADAIGPFPGGYYFEEWFGLFGQGDGKTSPYLREPRKVYYTYRELWNQR